MNRLFVEKTIEINAPAREVWDALTRRENTDQWAPEFSSGGPRFHLESNWGLGEPVWWKGEDGAVIVQGQVKALRRGSFLRFTVTDVRSYEKPASREDDGISFTLSERQGRTTLNIRHGDFSVYRDGKKYYELSSQTWDRVLRIVKRLAEHGPS